MQEEQDIIRQDEIEKEPGHTETIIPFPELTPAEREVALRIARGDTNRDVAAALKISVKTYDTHRGHLLKRLNARHNVDVCLIAIRRGYVVP